MQITIDITNITNILIVKVYVTYICTFENVKFEAKNYCAKNINEAIFERVGLC